MPRRLEQATVVVTGASSGIGRATALAFARRGASVALAARREEPLREVARECERAGGRAIAVPTDTTDEAAVETLARTAAETFGRLDVWVNNAAVTLFARFEEAPVAAFRRVIETNFFGYVHGARAALARFRAQGSGVLVNVASVNATIASPYVSAYVASKFAVRALGESLRQELRDERDIHVCTVLPASIDTPLFQHAGNLTGRAVKPLSPVLDAERVAAAIVRLAERPARETTVGGSGRMLRAARILAPGWHERMMAAQVERDHFQDARAPHTNGNLFEPVVEGTGVSGGWRNGSRRRVGPMAALAAAAVPIVGGVWVRRARS